MRKFPATHTRARARVFVCVCVCVCVCGFILARGLPHLELRTWHGRYALATLATGALVLSAAQTQVLSLSLSVCLCVSVSLCVCLHVYAALHAPCLCL